MPTKIEKGFGREIVLDVVDAKGLVPLGFEVEEPRAMLYRMVPHGKFGVKILTPALTDVIVRLDNVTLLERRVDPGLTTLTTCSDGAAFTFSPDGVKAPRVFAERPGQTAPVQEEVPADSAAPVQAPAEPEGPYAPSQGLLIVQVRFAHITPPNSPELPPDDYAAVLIQMNPAPAHLTAMASVLSKVVRPAKPEGISDVLGPDGEVMPAHQHRERICSVCNH